MQAALDYRKNFQLQKFTGTGAAGTRHSALSTQHSAHSLFFLERNPSREEWVNG